VAYQLASNDQTSRSFSEIPQQLKGTNTMRHRSSNSTKALVASLIALIVCANLAHSKGAQNPVDNRLTAASSKFSFKLYSELLKRRAGNNNTFVSPASVMQALAMTYNGAAGTTRDAMARTLGIEGMSLEDVNKAFADLKSALAPEDPKVQLKIANSLWVRNGFTLNPAFVARNKQHYAAEIASLNFADPTAPKTINSWVSKNTEGKIDKIIERINPGDVLFLINAIYFKGQWQFEFKKESTKPDVFRLAGGEQKQLPMMSQSGTYLYYKSKDFQSVVLPYGTGRVSMYVFLPDEQKGLDQFEKDLTPENWDTWLKSFQMYPGDLMLPRFKVEWESELNEALKTLGMEEAFDSARADFSGMVKVSSGNNLFISEVKQKSWCEVNEEGTVAAAVTSVGMSTTSVQKPREKFFMKVDRPFFFSIRDNLTGVVLFMGSVRNP
jgi:serine protease inhibitor